MTGLEPATSARDRREAYYWRSQLVHGRKPDRNKACRNLSNTPLGFCSKQPLCETLIRGSHGCCGPAARPNQTTRASRSSRNYVHHEGYQGNATPLPERCHCQLRHSGRGCFADLLFGLRPSCCRVPQLRLATILLSLFDLQLCVLRLLPSRMRLNRHAGHRANCEGSGGSRGQINGKVASEPLQEMGS
jgi:hypothetical protein